MQKAKITGTVLTQQRIGTDIYDLWVKAPEAAAGASAGQFVSLYTRDASRLLPRPISICERDPAQGALRLVYRVTGERTGTEEFSRLGAGDEIDLMGPLGNGFDAADAGTALLIGGGIGIPPMLELAKERSGENLIVAGYRDETYLTDDLEQAGSLYIATEDGSTGTKGTVIDAVKAGRLSADVIYACGPKPMLRAVKQYAREQDIRRCWLSLEERMACGVGACLGCVCESTEVDEHSQVKNKRVCKDGPVFSAWEVEL